MKIEHKFELGNQQIILETNRIAKQADASVVVTCGETMVMANICAAKTQKPDIDFFPLTSLTIISCLFFLFLDL